LVERAIIGPSARSHCLPGFWLLVEQQALGLTLRLAHDARGDKLYPTPTEQAAERIRELEAALKSRDD
jgi:hypothetical protein